MFTPSTRSRTGPRGLSAMAAQMCDAEQWVQLLMVCEESVPPQLVEGAGMV